VATWRPRGRKPRWEKYRVYLIGSDGHIFHRTDAIFATDEEACAFAGTLVAEIVWTEVWSGTRRVMPAPGKATWVGCHDEAASCDGLFSQRIDVADGEPDA
jgi:hypothetical protein